MIIVVHGSVYDGYYNSGFGFSDHVSNSDSDQIDVSFVVTIMGGYGEFGIRLGQTINGGFLTNFYVGSNPATNFGSELYLILCKEIKQFIYSGIIEIDNIYTIITNPPTIELTDFTQNPGFQSVNGILGNESIIDIKTYFYVWANVIINTSDYFLINYVWMGSVNGDFDNGGSISIWLIYYHLI